MRWDHRTRWQWNQHYLLLVVLEPQCSSSKGYLETRVTLPAIVGGTEQGYAHSLGLSQPLFHPASWQHSPGRGGRRPQGKSAENQQRTLGEGRHPPGT